MIFKIRNPDLNYLSNLDLSTDVFPISGKHKILIKTYEIRSYQQLF